MWLLLYALAVLYVSLVVSPVGFAFQQHYLEDAWKIFTNMPYYRHGADQRSDQMGNLLMFVPMGFLAAGAATRRTDGGVDWSRYLLVLGGCTLFVLAVKFAQIFFPRTVSLNYVLLQIAGSAIGVALFHLSRSRPVSRLAEAATEGRVVRAALRVYASLLVLFYLFPLNFALGRGELRDRMAEVPGLLLAIPGTGRTPAQQIAVLIASVAATLPLGVMLGLDRLRSLGRAILIGLLLLVAVQAVSVPLISGTPSFVHLALRLSGMLLGFGLLRWLEQRSATWLRRKAHGLVPWLVLPYLVVLVLANDLTAGRWTAFDELVRNFDTRALIPLWTHYIVSKAQAAVSVVIHMAMYAPIGLMLGLRGKADRATAWSAAALAFVLALAIELVRLFKQLGGDLNNAPIAAVAAGGAVVMVPRLWRAIDEILTRPIVLERAPPTRAQRGPLW